VTGKKLTKNRIIVVNNWGKHQGSDSQNDSQNDKQVDRTATGQRQDSDSRYKNNRNIEDKNKEKEYKEKEKPAALLPDTEEGIDLWTDFEGELIE
jgi:hypothetical protein